MHAHVAGILLCGKSKKKEKEKTQNNAKQTNKQTNKQRKSTPGRTGPGPEDNTKSVNARMVCPRGSLPQPQQPSEPTEWSIQIQPGRKRKKERGGRKRKGAEAERAEAGGSRRS